MWCLAKVSKLNQWKKRQKKNKGKTWLTPAAIIIIYKASCSSVKCSTDSKYSILCEDFETTFFWLVGRVLWRPVTNVLLCCVTNGSKRQTDSSAVAVDGTETEAPAHKHTRTHKVTQSAAVLPGLTGLWVACNPYVLLATGPTQLIAS